MLLSLKILKIKANLFILEKNKKKKKKREIEREHNAFGDKPKGKYISRAMI